MKGNWLPHSSEPADHGVVGVAPPEGFEAAASNSEAGLEWYAA